MDEVTKQKILNVAKYIKETHSTVRETADYFKISKSTIHRDIKHRLMDIDFEMYKDVINIIYENKMERSIRGGMQTKLKFSKNKIKGEDEKMELISRQEKVMEAVKLIKNKGIPNCSRQDIMQQLGVKKNYSEAGYANIFKELEEINKLIKAPKECKGNGIIKYILNDYNNTNDIVLLNSRIGKAIKIQDIMECTKIPQQLIYKFTSKIKEDKVIIRTNENYLCLNLNGFKKLLNCLTNDGNITKNQEALLMKIDNYMNEQYEIDIEDDTYEDLTDLDEIFDSLLKTVDTISTRINTFKNVKDDRDKQIRVLESDKAFYKGKCEEYRRNTTRLQEKIDALRWG